MVRKILFHISSFPLTCLKFFFFPPLFYCSMFFILSKGTNQNSCNCESSGRGLVSHDLRWGREECVLHSQTVALWNVLWRFRKPGLPQRHGWQWQRWTVFFPVVQRWTCRNSVGSECRVRLAIKQIARCMWSYVGKRCEISLKGNIKKTIGNKEY